MPPRNARSGPRNRRYYEINGERYWSVTTITKGGLPEGYGLQKWKRTIVAKGAVDAVLDGSLELLAKRSPDSAVQYLADLPFARTKKAADLGTAIHAAIEALVLGKPTPDVEEEALPYLAQFELFLKEYEPRFLMAEATVFHRAHWYAGTLDAVVEIDGRVHLLDVKTGTGIYPEVALQLAAYRNAEKVSLPGGLEEPMLEADPDVALCLHLQPDGYDLIDVDISHPVLMAFLYCRETFRWDNETSKRVLRGTYRRASTDPIALEQLRLEEERKAKRNADGPAAVPVSTDAPSATLFEATADDE